MIFIDISLARSLRRIRLPKWLRRLFVFRSCRTKFSLDALPYELLLLILSKMEYWKIARMMRTCSGIKGICDNNREKFFTRKGTGVHLYFWMNYECGIWISQLMRSINPIKADFIRGMSVHRIVVNISLCSLSVETIRNYFRSFRLKCDRLIVIYAENRNEIDVSDVFQWKEISVHESPEQIFDIEDYVDLIKNL